MQNEDREWLDYRMRFSDVYDKANYDSFLQSAVMNASHRLTERRFTKNNHFSSVLEIGAGTGEHFDFVNHSFDKYVLSDLDSKTLDIAKLKINSKLSEKITFEVQSGDSLTYPDNSFDRLIATHVLEHIYKPHEIIKEWRRVIKNGGILSVLIPTDPGIAWRLGRHLGPRKNSIAQGVAYDYVMAREHVNSCNNLVTLLRHYFPIRTEAWWPMKIPSIDLNLFYLCHCIVTKSGT